MTIQVACPSAYSHFAQAYDQDGGDCASDFCIARNRTLHRGACAGQVAAMSD